MIYSGLNSTLSIGIESVWGTAVTPTQYIRFNSIDANLDYKDITSKEKTGSRVASQPMQGSKLGNLKLSGELNKADIGIFLYGVMGLKSAVTGAGPYTRTYTATTSNKLPSFTMRLIRAGFQGALLTGVTISKISFKHSKDSFIQFDMEAVYKDETDIALTISSVTAATGIFTCTNTFVANQPVKLIFGTTYPDFINEDQTYYVSAPTGANFKVSATSGGTALTGTTTGTGTMRVLPLETLTRSTDTKITSNDCTVTISGTAANEVLTFNIDVNNNPVTDTQTVNSGKNISGIYAGQLEVSGSFEAIFNTGTEAYKTLRDNNTLTAFQAVFADGAQGLTGASSQVRLSGGAIKEDDNRCTVSYNFSSHNLTTPWTWTLVNGSAT